MREKARGAEGEEDSGGDGDTHTSKHTRETIAHAMSLPECFSLSAWIVPAAGGASVLVLVLVPVGSSLQREVRARFVVPGGSMRAPV